MHRGNASVHRQESFHKLIDAQSLLFLNALLVSQHLFFRHKPHQDRENVPLSYHRGRDKASGYLDEDRC